MKRFLSICIMICLLFGLASCANLPGASVATTETPEVVNLIKNGDFEQGNIVSHGKGQYEVYKPGNGVGSIEVTDGMGIIHLEKPGPQVDGVQMSYSSVSLEKGKTYRFSIDASCTTRRDIEIGILNPAGGFNVEDTQYYWREDITVDTTMRTYTAEFRMDYPSNTHARIAINCGKAASNYPATDVHDVFVDNLVLSLVPDDAMSAWGYQLPNISVDQLGYTPEDTKKAIVTAGSELYEIFRVSDNVMEFAGKAKLQAMSGAAGEEVRIADFSRFRKEGTFYIQNDEGRSLPFTISKEPYRNVRSQVFDMFRYQQSGIGLDYGPWKHGAGQTALATIYGTDIQKDVSGGWYDARDYGRYVVSGVQTVADLLLAERLALAPDRDVLVETRTELEWLLKMQDPETGGVYHKVTTAGKGDVSYPDEEEGELIISPISSTATADFAAIMAMAYRTYRDGSPVFAQEMIDASRKAWAWLQEHQEYPMFENPEGISTREYGASVNPSDTDERYWAACELYVSTGEPFYHDYIKRGWIFHGFDWANVGDFGNVSYLLDGSDYGQDEYTVIKIKNAILNHCEQVRARQEQEPYGISLATYDYASNMTIVNDALLLLVGNHLEARAGYQAAAREQIRYLFGKNPLSQSYLTGMGENAVKSPAHNLSERVGPAVPGMLVGGPNTSFTDAKGDVIDDYTKNILEGQPPAKCYIDGVQSWSTNEPSIAQNAALYFVLRMLGL
ncbi:endoglucanase [Clostridia bacterium]|nr:endoglucanase [Clostridia bacterium]